jgi:hypothetical protein
MVMKTKKKSGAGCTKKGELPVCHLMKIAGEMIKL